MYNTVKNYYDFLRKQEQEREMFLETTKNSVIEEMGDYMSKHGWLRKGKGQKVNYTKKFNGKDIVIEFRCNYGKDFNGGFPEFVHDKSIPKSIDKIQMGYFHWNDQNSSSGWSLDVVMGRMEVFYTNYTK